MIRTRPNPPLLGCGFYFPDVGDADALALLVEELVHLGAQFAGEVLVSYGIGARATPFIAATDLPSTLSELEVLPLHSSELQQYLTDPDVRVLQVGLNGAIGLGSYEVVAHARITPNAVGVNPHPVMIWTEGSLFSFPDVPDFSGERMVDAQRQAGKQVYGRFKSIVKDLAPAYGSITIEYPLECPADLRIDPRSYAFRDFYIKRDYIGRTNLTDIAEEFADAYVEDVGDGLYVSCFSAFNPANRQLDSTLAISRSIRVATLIASVG